MSPSTSWSTSSPRPDPVTSPLRPVLLLVALTLATRAFAADAASPVIARQIDELLKHRLRPEPLPIDLPNPFATQGATIQRATRSTTVVESTPRNGTGEEPADREAARATHSQILADCAARLRIGGTIRLKDQAQIVINDTPRKPGDLLIVPYQNTRIPIEIVRLLPDRVNLRYLEEEIAVKF